MAGLIWLETGAALVGVDNGILKGRDVQHIDAWAAMAAEARQRAAAIVREAEADARAIRGRAGQEADELRAAAHDAAAAIAAAAREEGAREAARTWHEREQAHRQAAAQALAGMPERLGQVVVQAVERIVRVADRQALFEKAAEELRAFGQGLTRIAWRICPQDRAAAQAAIAAAGGTFDGIAIDLIEETGAPPGSCVFESPLGTLDASLDTQLQALRTAIAHGAAQVEAPETGSAAAPSDAADGTSASAAEAGRCDPDTPADVEEEEADFSAFARNAPWTQEFAGPDGTER